MTPPPGAPAASLRHVNGAAAWASHGMGASPMIWIMSTVARRTAVGGPHQVVG